MEPMDINYSNPGPSPPEEKSDSVALHNASAEVKSLQQENRKLKSQLNECKSKLLSANDDEGVSDVTIQKNFERIGDAIENWINALERYETKGYFRDRIQGMWSDRRKWKYLDRLVFYQAGENFSGDKMNSETRWMQWLKNQDTSNCVVLSVLIWRFLESNIFNKAFPIGNPEEMTTVLGDILREIRRDENGKDAKARANKWRYDSTNLLVDTQFYRRARHSREGRLFEKLKSELKPWTSESASKDRDLGKSLREDILGAAVQLHQDMKCSEREYYLKLPDVPRGEGRKAEVQEKAKGWTRKFIETWMWATSPSTIEGVFDVLYPALWRRGVDDESDLELVKPSVVVFKNKPSWCAGSSERQNEFPLQDTQSRRHRGKRQSRNHSRDPSSSRAIGSFMSSILGRPAAGVRQGAEPGSPSPTTSSPAHSRRSSLSQSGELTHSSSRLGHYTRPPTHRSGKYEARSPRLVKTDPLPARAIQDQVDYHKPPKRAETEPLQVPGSEHARPEFVRRHSEALRDRDDVGAPESESDRSAEEDYDNDSLPSRVAVKEEYASTLPSNLSMSYSRVPPERPEVLRDPTQAYM